MIAITLTKAIEKALQKVMTNAKAGKASTSFVLEHPTDFAHGDYSSNVAMAYAKALKTNPRALAEKIIVELKKKSIEGVSSVELAGPGFINFRLDRTFFPESVKDIIDAGKLFGRNDTMKGKKVLIEYTDPNPFKVFHIGHLMSNAIGESVSRVIEFSGAKIIRANYQGDVGLHVAKALWGALQLEKEFPDEDASIGEMVNYIGRGYVLGSEKYESDPTAKEQIVAVNKIIFDKSDPKLMKIYNWGRKVSLLHFEEIYKKLGTRFDEYFFESEVAADGAIIVRDFLKRGVFVDSEGAVVFKGEEHGLHTRVFINSQGLPTYEAKEVGLSRIKFDRFNPDLSIVVTATEQADYFKVVMKALSIMFPYIEAKTKHVTHGMLRFESGKMSSRKGNIITGESLLDDVEVMVLDKMSERAMTGTEKKEAAEAVAVGAIKYSILKQATGSDIIYDFNKSISFEGDSGPYLQYACVRALSILTKAKEQGLKPIVPKTKDSIIGRIGRLTGAKKKSAESNLAEITVLERMLYRFPEIVVRAQEHFEPHHVVTYLIELSAAFNSFYANNLIIDAKDPQSPYRLALTEAFATVMKNGLYVLGIKLPAKM